MTDATFFPTDDVADKVVPGGESPRRPPPVKPPWLRSSALVAVVLAHGLVALGLMATAVQTISPLDSVSMDLIPEGDFFEQQETAAADDTPPPEAVEEPELVAPPPLVMNPDAPKLAVKKEEVEKKIVQKREERQEVERAKEKRLAQMRRRMGAPEGRSQGSNMSKAAYAGLLARAIRAHTPGSASAGAGSASCTFHVTSGGGMSGVSCSGSHAALGRRIISSVHAPPPPGGGFFAAQAFHFH